MVLGVVLDLEPLPVGVELGVQFDHSAADGQDPKPDVEVVDAKLGQLAPAQAALDLGFGEQPEVLGGQVVVQVVEPFASDDLQRLARDRRGLDAVAGVEEDDLVVQWVARIADRIILLCRIVAGVTPCCLSLVIHSRTCSGRMSIILMSRNSGMRCL